jgi:hypothetical protein
MNLYDIMRSAGGGHAFAALARQYDLSESDVAKAVEAFMPAFSVGLKRGTSDPLGLMEFMRRMALGDYARAYWDPAEAGREGEEALAFVFGSPEVARALAEQAAAFTGLAQQKVRELMPALAAMAFGGLAEQSKAVNPVLDAMLKEIRASARKPAAKGPLDRLEEEEARREAEAAAIGDFARMQKEMMGAGLAAVQAGTAAWQKAMQQTTKGIVGGGAMAGDATKPETEPEGADVFGEMFEPGLRLSEAYQREIEALLARHRPEIKRPSK